MAFPPLGFPPLAPPPQCANPSRATRARRAAAVLVILVTVPVIDVWHFLVDNRPELWSETAAHARLVALALLVSVPPAMALGVAAARRPRLAALAVGTAGVIFTIPSLALYALLVAPLGLGTTPAVAALALYSVLPVLRNTVVGLRAVPAEAVEAARGMGMTESQALWRVRLPLALPVVVGGVRVAAVTAVGVATVAALVAAGGLGDSIFAGLRADDPTEVLAATLLIAGLALAVDGGLALVERLLRRGPGRPGGPGRRRR